MLSVSVPYYVPYMSNGRQLRSVGDMNCRLLYGDLFSVCQVTGCWRSFITTAVSEFVVMALNMVIVCCRFIVFCPLMFLCVLCCMCVVFGISVLL